MVKACPTANDEIIVSNMPCTSVVVEQAFVSKVNIKFEQQWYSIVNNMLFQEEGGAEIFNLQGEDRFRLHINECSLLLRPILICSAQFQNPDKFLFVLFRFAV